MNIGLFGNRVFADAFKMRSHCIMRGPNPMTGVLVIRKKFGHRYTGTVEAKTSKQARPRIAGNKIYRRGMKQILPLPLQELTNPTNTFNLNF